jgi:hypothetical protein
VTSSSYTIGGRSGQIEINFSPKTTMLKSGVIYIIVPKLSTSVPADNYCAVEMNTGTPNVVFGSPSGSII